jgi:ubiquinone/menaquinone biosynthesis C-methylase UbiE
MTSDLSVSPRLKQNYDSYYEGESEWRALGALDKAKNIANLCGAIAHKRILDIGSGEGAILKRLSDMHFGDALYSLEISQSAVTTIAQRAIPGVKECQLFDGYHVPYGDRQFDLAIMSHVLEHVEHPRKLLQEASRVADYVFIEVPLEDTIRMPPDFVCDSVGHINFYSWKTIRRLVQTCDLQILSQVITHSSRPMYEYQSGRKGILKHAIKECLLRASKRLACQLFTYHASIVCTRTCE